ncbi:hypothetical protein F4001_05940, partial [Candidatus Poribacteria bacterium]|nr:hypothetical protein [Candidatus Poribacteria bacterium]
MKLLFDQNLSPKLVYRMEKLFPNSIHVQSVGLDTASDSVLWHYARTNDFLIVTKNADFSDRSAIEGYPPKVIWFRGGNSSTEAVEKALTENYLDIETFVRNPDQGVLA